MKKLVILSFILLSGCSTYGGWKPVVDYRTTQYPQYIERDLAECQAYAREASGTIKETLMGTGVGALAGAASGAALGAIMGNPATGAAIGSVAGIGGGLYSGVGADSRFRLAYSNCMRGRGHNVIN
jgi:outer membrane lipoprotein SlyB